MSTSKDNLYQINKKIIQLKVKNTSHIFKLINTSSNNNSGFIDYSNENDKNLKNKKQLTNLDSSTITNNESNSNQDKSSKKIKSIVNDKSIDLDLQNTTSSTTSINNHLNATNSYNQFLSNNISPAGKGLIELGKKLEDIDLINNQNRYNYNQQLTDSDNNKRKSNSNQDKSSKKIKSIVNDSGTDLDYDENNNQMINYLDFDELESDLNNENDESNVSCEEKDNDNEESDKENENEIQSDDDNVSSINNNLTSLLDDNLIDELNKNEFKHLSIKDIERALDINKDGNTYWRCCIKMLIAKNENGSPKYQSIQWSNDRYNLGIFKIADKEQFCHDLQDLNMRLKPNNIKYEFCRRSNPLICLTTNHGAEILEFQFEQWSILMNGKRLLANQKKDKNIQEIIELTDKVNIKHLEILTPLINQLNNDLSNWAKNINTENQMLNLLDFIKKTQNALDQRMYYDGTCNSTCNKGTKCAEKKGNYNCLCRILQVECSLSCKCGHTCSNKDNKIKNAKNDAQKEKHKCFFPCEDFKEQIQCHYVSTHLPVNKYVCLKCNFYVKSAIHFHLISNHLKNHHGVVNPVKDKDYEKHIPNTNINKYKNWYPENSVFGKVILNPLKYPVSEELFRWSMDKLSKDERELLKNSVLKFNKRPQEKKIKSSCLYFILDINNLEDNQISKIEFLERIHKIGQTEDIVSRKIDYRVLKGKMILISLLDGQSSKDIIYGEKITTQNINLSNLEGSERPPHYIHIGESYLNFKEQNLFSIYLFNEAYNKFLSKNY